MLGEIYDLGGLALTDEIIQSNERFRGCYQWAVDFSAGRLCTLRFWGGYFQACAKWWLSQFVKKGG